MARNHCFKDKTQESENYHLAHPTLNYLTENLHYKDISSQTFHSKAEANLSESMERFMPCAGSKHQP